MNTPEQFTPPLGAAPTEQSATVRTKLLRVFTFTVAIGSVVVLLAGAIVLFADWFSKYHFTRQWQQVSATFGGCVLLATALLIPSIRQLSRLLLSITGVLLLSAVWDSLDGLQQFLPIVSLLLWFWAAIYIYTLAKIQQAKNLSIIRRQLTVSLGLIVIMLYLGAAIYYIIINRMVGLVNVNSHPLYGFGIIIATLLQWLGGIYPYTNTLTGKVRVCSHCSLRNIRERSVCKRCGAALGAIEEVR